MSRWSFHLLAAALVILGFSILYVFPSGPPPGLTTHLKLKYDKNQYTDKITRQTSGKELPDELHFITRVYSWSRYDSVRSFRRIWISAEVRHELRTEASSQLGKLHTFAESCAVIRSFAPELQRELSASDWAEVNRVMQSPSGMYSRTVYNPFGFVLAATAIVCILIGLCRVPLLIRDFYILLHPRRCSECGYACGEFEFCPECGRPVDPEMR